MRELTYGDWHVLDGYGIDELPPGAAGQPLIPWPNRLADGRYEFGGRTLQLPITEPERRNALHGLARWMTWHVEEHEASRAVLSLLMYPRQGYPFALSLEIEYRVGPSNVTVVTNARNVGRAALPYASGFHPYVTVGSPSIDSCMLTVPAATFLPLDQRRIPTGRSPVTGTEFDFSAARPVGKAQLDIPYTDLARDDDGVARVVLCAPDSSRSVTVRMDQTHRFVMVYTGDALHDPPRRRRSVAIEPMTAAPNAFQSGDGLRVLGAGELFSSEWGIELS